MDKKFEANKEFMGNVSLQCIKCMANKKQTNKQTKANKISQWVLQGQH